MSSHSFSILSNNEICAYIRCSLSFILCLRKMDFPFSDGVLCCCCWNPFSTSARRAPSCCSHHDKKKYYFLWFFPVRYNELTKNFRHFRCTFFFHRVPAWMTCTTHSISRCLSDTFQNRWMMWKFFSVSRESRQTDIKGGGSRARRAREMSAHF